ncbi:MAG TPA: cyanophycin synthetase [Candidatus Limnocylindrales bacterium]|nr:cyanophycin synthetase [Candidatus Limnocylindrales bacterium]
MTATSNPPPDRRSRKTASGARPRRTRRGTQAPAGARPLPELRIVETRVYRGPNYWNYDPAVKLVVDLGVLEHFPSNTIPGFVTALLEMLPGVGQHTCGTGKVGGFTDRLKEGTWVGHVAEHIALQLQREAGTEVGRGKTRGTGEPGRYHVVYSYGEESVGLAAGRLAVRLVNHLVQAEDGFDFAAELERLILLAERVAFGPSTQAILDEAALRDIPSIRLNEQSLVQLGHGIHQKRIRATMTSQTGSLGVDIASDKKLTNRLLAATGVPVPRSQMVRDEDGAVAAAKRIGFPVAIKPLDGNHGRGVMLNLADDDAVRDGFRVARAESRRGGVIVESYLTGNDYRCLVIGGVLRAVAQRVPAHVEGDGKHSVSQLVELTNADPRRGIGHEKVLTRIKLDEEAVSYAREQGFELSDVPPRAHRVYLKRTGNMSTGGISIDRTEEIHPDNAEIAELAARVVGLDIAGIDLVCPDAGQPIRETGGGIVEVNAAPGFRMHTNPTEGEPQYVAKPVIEMLFPPGAPSRIPIVAVTGSNGKTTTARMIAHVMKGMGRKVGLTSTDGIYVDGRIVRRADASGPKSASMVLQNPTVDFAVFEVARGGILREGLGYQRNDVAVVLNVTGDHLGLGGIHSIKQLAEVKRVIVEAVPRDGVAVLNADDPNVLAMARHCSGSVIYFSMDPEHERLKFQAARGRRAVTVERGNNGEKIVLRHGRKSMDLVWTHLIPATFEGRARMNVQNALAATAAAWAAGAHLHDIRQGLRTFSTSYFMAPGRLNMFELDGYRVVVDYAHNPPAVQALGEFVHRLTEPSPGGARASVTGRRIGVMATAGDRRDEDIRELGRVAARHFDEIIIREDANNRGRPRGETAALIADGIESAGPERRVGDVVTILDELEATRAALDRAGDGDVVVVCVDHANQVWKELQRRQHGAASETDGLRAVVGIVDADGDDVDLDL